MSETIKITELEHSVLFDTPEELDRTCRRLGPMKKRSRALGIACQFRGLEWVKVLVNNKVFFEFDDMRELYVQPYKNPYGQAFYALYDNFMFSLVDFKLKVRQMDEQRLYFKPGKEGARRFDSIIAFDKEFFPISEEERLKCVKYFTELNNKTVCDLQRLLYLAIINCDTKVTAILRKNGIKLSENARNMLTGEKESDHYFFWSFCHNIRVMNPDAFITAVNELSSDLGSDKKININVWFMDNTRKIFYETKVFDCILDNFNQKKINKKKTMQEIISLEKTELLAICEKNGWLKLPKKRDEMIQFASDSGKTESTAWLLDFKNRTADLKAEQEKTEKKLMRELNANPDSLTELKKIWGFEAQKDGGIIITRYKGNRTEIEVPDSIGGNAVKEIGEFAFSPNAMRIRTEQREFRKTITKITLPETVTAIGKGAFADCMGLTEVNIPKGVKSIGTSAFYGCQSLLEIDIPLSVQEMGQTVFSVCKSLVFVNLPNGIKEIGVGEFSGCESLERVIIPPTVQKIEKWAFLRCFSLEEIIIPDGVEEIGEKAFAYCTKLKSLTLPQSVKKIKNYTHNGRKPETAFSEDKNLTVTVSPKSYGERYCKRNNIAYINL